MKQLSVDTLGSLNNVIDHLASEQGKREIIMASSGFLAVSMQEQKNRVIERNLRAGIVINALDSKGLFGEAPAGLREEDPVGYCCGPTAQRAPGRQQMYQTIEIPLRLDTLNEAMANLAEGTGGKFFHHNNDLNAGFRELGAEPAAVYRFSFRTDGAGDGEYHNLKVTAKKFPVQSRPGYFNEKEAETLQSKIDREIMGNDAIADFPVGIAVEHRKDAFTVIVSVDVSKLRFTKQGDRQVQRIAFVSALFDGRGKMAAAKESEMDLSLSEATYRRLAASGLNAKVTLRAPAGRYRLRQVSEEAVEGKLACSSHPVTVR